MIRTRTWTILLIVCFAFLFFIRFIHLTADPPYNLSQSGAPWGDPGGYSFNARNKVLFGTWEVDNYNMMYTSYPPHLTTYAMFSLLGVGFAQQNAVPVFFSCLSLILFFLILRKKFDGPAALLAVSLLGLNYSFLMYSRIANRIMPAIFFLLLGIFLMEKARDRSIWLVGTGMSFILALASKSIIYYAVAGLLAGYFFYMLFNRPVKDLLLRTGLILAGALSVLLPWIFFIYFPKHEYINSFGRLNVPLLLPPANISKLMEHFWTRPSILLERMPVITVLAAIFSLVLLYRTIHAPKKVALLDWLFLGWYYSGFFYLAIIYQRVPRRFIPMILPLVFLAASLAYEIFRKSGRLNHGKPRWVFAPFAFVWMLFPVSILLKFFSGKFTVLFSKQISLNLTLLILSAVLTAFLFSAARWNISSKPARLLPAYGKISLLVLGLIFFVSHGYRYLSWATNPPRQLHQISQDYGKAFQDAVFVGLWAPIICLENSHRAHEYFRKYINSYQDLFEKFGITHVFTTTHFGEDRTFKQDFPHIMKNAKLLARYHIWTVQILLFDINPSIKKQEKGLYEAELYTQKGNIPRYDQKASGNFAVLCRSKKPISVVSIPIEKTYQKGVYEVAFRLKVGKDISHMTSRAGRLVVSSALSRKVLAYKDLFPEDLNSRDYKDIIFPFQLRKPSSIELLLFSDGEYPIWVDLARIRMKVAETI